MRLNLTLSVTKTEFAAGSTGAGTAGNAVGATMQITGRVVEENQHVKMGAFHTLDLEMNRDVRIIKETWDRVALDRVEEASADGRGAEVGAIVCGEGNPTSLSFAQI